MSRSRLAISVFLLVSTIPLERDALALPAFAMREKVSCNMCHTNGSAPHLTEYGYLYRRAGFRPPYAIGDVEADAKATGILEHLAVGVNVDYEWANSTPPGQNQVTTMNSNQINVPEVELWPLIGGFFGNYAVWSEIDASPSTAQSGQTATSGGFNLTSADLRYVVGDADHFINFRVGLLAPEGYGASDQWLDDANIPVMDQMTPQYNQDSLAIPFGAMNIPELGAELGLNYHRAHITLGVFDGFTGTTQSNNQPTLTPTTMQKTQGISKDWKGQIDQFIEGLGAVTAAYYTGTIQLINPSTAQQAISTTNPVLFTWFDHYKQGRLYLTSYAVHDTLDLLLGGTLDQNQYVYNNAHTPGTFQSRGSFLGANYYVMPHLTLAARTDFFQYNCTADAPAHANAYSFQASVPYQNNLWIFHYNMVKTEATTASIAAGTYRDFRAEWRFLF